MIYAPPHPMSRGPLPQIGLLFMMNVCGEAPPPRTPSFLPSALLTHGDGLWTMKETHLVKRLSFVYWRILLCSWKCCCLSSEFCTVYFTWSSLGLNKYWLTSRSNLEAAHRRKLQTVFFFQYIICILNKNSSRQTWKSAVNFKEWM